MRCSQLNFVVCSAHPACGAGNFLYVSLELMKRLEGSARRASFGDVERTPAVFTSVSDAWPLDAKILARAFRQGAKAEQAIARVLASLARLGHIYTADGRDYSLRRRA
jgi:hypothetical protein